MKKGIKKVAQTFALVLALCATSRAWAELSVGDAVPGLSNTGTAGTISKYSECCFSFCIPATDDLPEGSVVRIKKIKFAEVETHGTNENTPYYLALNTCQSAAVVQDTVNKIQANSSTSCNTLTYSFEGSQCLIVVGTTYTQLGADGGYNAYRFNAGYGLTFLHSNGNRWSSGTTMQCAVTFVNTSDSDSVIATTTSSGAGYYPVYDIEAEVVSIPNEKSPDFEYNAVVGNAYASDYSGNWGASTPSGSYCRVGPNCNNFVFEYGAANSPNWGMAAKSSAFSFITYADVSETQSSGRAVLLGFGSNLGNNTCALYREGADIKLAYYQAGQNTLVGTAASLTLPSSGFHLIAGVCDPTKGTLKLYVGKNDGTLDSATGGTATEQAVAMNAGFQICSVYHGNGGFTKANNFALAKILGFDRVLSEEVVESFLEDFPATDGTQITADISPSSGTTTVYTSSAVGNQYLGITSGTLTIPAGNTVTVPQMRVNNSSAITVNINGTVNVNSTMETIAVGKTPYDLRDSYKGILLGEYDANVAGTYNITGTLYAPNAYLQTCKNGAGQAINISGGSVFVKGIYEGGYYNNSYATINLGDGGTLEVGEIVTLGTTVAGIRNFNNGTYRVLSSGTENYAIKFGAGAGEFTTIDSNGNTLTFPSSGFRGMSGNNIASATAVTGSGDIKVASSVSGGRVKFNSITTDYTGNITVAANSTMELVAGAYAGTITVESGGTLEINPGTDVDYTCYATLAGAGSVVIKSGNVTLASSPTVTSAISVDSGATLILPTGTISGVSGSGTLEIPDGVEVTVTANNAITVGSLKGPGTLAMSGVGPGSSNTTLQSLLQNANWDGTFAIKNVTRDNSNGLKGLDLHLWGNSGSKLQLTGVQGYFNRKNSAENIANQPELVLIDGTGDRAYGYKSDDGWSYTVSSSAHQDSYTIIRKLSGTGTLLDGCNPSHLYVFNDASDFSGSIAHGTRASPWGKAYLFATGVTPSALPGQASGTSFDGDKATAGTIDVRSGASVSIGDDCSWQAQNGIRIAGDVTLKGSATLSSSATFVSGAKLIFKAGSVLNASSMTLPASGTVALDVTALTIPSAGYTLISGVTFTAEDCDKFSITAGSGEYYTLVPESTTLKIYPNGASATENGVTTKYSKFTDAFYALMTSSDASVYVTPLADAPSYTDEDLLTARAALDADGNYYKATVKIGTKGYKSLARAVALADDEDTITLIQNNAEINVGLSDKTITFAEDSYTFTGSFTGNGTLTLMSTLKSADTARWAEGWTGTVVLPANQTFGGLVFDHYGIRGSTVRLQGTNTGWLQYRSNNDPIATTVEIPYGVSLTITGWSPSFANAFDVLKGAGAFAVSIDSAPDTSGGSSLTAYFLLKDVANFTGSLSASGAGIAIGDTRIANTVAGGKIIVASGNTATVGAISTWTADTIEVNGTVSVASGGAFTGTIVGSGEISLAALVNSAMSLGDWTGTVELPAITETVGGFRFDYYGKAGSTVKISKGFTGWLNTSTGDAYQVKARILVTGCTFTISGSNSATWYQIAKLSGDGDFSFVQSNQPYGFHIGVVENFTGTISNSDDNGATPTALTITRINIDSDPASARETKIVNTTTAGAIAVGGVYYNDTAVNLSRSLSKKNKADGIYIVRAGTIFSVY